MVVPQIDVLHLLPPKAKRFQLVEVYNQLTSLVQFVAEHAFKAAQVQKKSIIAKNGRLLLQIPKIVHIINVLLPIFLHTFPLNACSELLVRTCIVILKPPKHLITTQSRALVNQIGVHAVQAICYMYTNDWCAQHIQPHLSVSQTYYDFRSQYLNTYSIDQGLATFTPVAPYKIYVFYMYILSLGGAPWSSAISNTEGGGGG